MASAKAIDGGVILITGASSGIGAEIARQVGGRAKRLVLVARRKERLDQLAEELRGRHSGLSVEVAPCDLSDLRATEEMIRDAQARVGPVDVLVNNAGLGDVTLFERSDPTKTERMITVNVLALQLLTRVVLPGMVDRGRGGVLNISSGFGLAWVPGLAAYIGTKHFVTAFSESLRAELHGTGVVVTQICPGPVTTEFEGVAGNPTGEEVPSIVQIDAVRCARESIAALDRGAAMHLPGLLMRWITRLGVITPRWLLRLVYGPMGAMLRKRQLTYEAAGGAASETDPGAR